MKDVPLSTREETTERKLVCLVNCSNEWDFVALTEEQYNFLEYLMDNFNLEEYIEIVLNPTATEI